MGGPVWTYNIDQSRNMSLNRCTTSYSLVKPPLSHSVGSHHIPQQQINLIIIISKAFEILNTPQRRLPIRHRRVEEVLLPVLVHTETLKVNVAARSEVGLDWSRDENGRLAVLVHPELSHAALDDVELDGDYAGYLDGAAK